MASAAGGLQCRTTARLWLTYTTLVYIEMKADGRGDPFRGLPASTKRTTIAADPLLLELDPDWVQRPVQVLVSLFWEMEIGEVACRVFPQLHNECHTPCRATTVRHCCSH